jgi:hypothetical protein
VAQVQESTGEISKGIWFSAIDEIGPYTDAGEQPGEATINASMRTAAFDSAVTSSTDDPFRISVDPTSDGFGTPVLIQPGGVGTIRVTIRPDAAKGAKVHGHLNLVTPPFLPAGATALPFYTTGATITTVPYAYTVG